MKVVFFSKPVENLDKRTKSWARPKGRPCPKGGLEALQISSEVAG